MQRLTLQGASVGGNGGAVATNPASGTITLDDVVLYNNTAGTGGGIFLSNGLTGNFDQVRFISKTASLGAGAILVAGGASLNISNADIEWNNTTAGGADGGAIYTVGGGSNTLSLTCRHYITNNSSLHNVEPSSARCKAPLASRIAPSTAIVLGSMRAPFFSISAADRLTPVLDQLTFDGNTVESGSGGAIYNNGINVLVSRSIIFGNGAVAANNLANSGGRPFTSGNFNILPVVQDGLGGDTHDSLVDPNLAAPANNGGFSFTQAIDQLSSAFNRASTTSLLVDQRGIVPPPEWRQRQRRL